MPAPLAAVLVVLSSAAVLVLEVLVSRLVAPYVGLTLETYTAAIGVALGAIAAEEAEAADVEVGSESDATGEGDVVGETEAPKSETPAE